MAGRRIARLLRDELASVGVTHVVVSGYANAYCGYLTTREEYQVQGYEGASNYMGQWTLGVVLTQLREMATQLQDAPTPVSPLGSDALRPEPFTVEELALREFDPATL